MQVLKRGHTELFRRGPDECFDSLAELTRFCQEQKAKSVDRWLSPRTLKPRPLALDRLVVDFSDPAASTDGTYHLNDWSFTQLCQLAKVSRDTVNRVTADTAWRVFQDTLPDGNKPLQLYTEGEIIRSTERQPPLKEFPALLSQTEKILMDKTGYKLQARPVGSAPGNPKNYQLDVDLHFPGSS